MELNQLKCFQAVARTESITKAAEEYFITQSALSRVILRLESELGTPLFDRKSGRITLNEKGKLFLAHVNVAMKELEEGVKEVTGDNGGSNVYMYNYLATNVFETITSRCQAEFPDLEFQNHNYETNESEDPIRKFAPHILITPCCDVKGYSVVREYREKWCVLMNKKYKCSLPEDAKSVTLEELTHENIAFFGSEYDKEFITSTFGARGMVPKLQPVANTAESGELINRCKAIGLVTFNNYLHIVNGIEKMPIKALMVEDCDFSRPVYLMKKSKFPANDGQRAALEFIVNFLDEDNDNIERYAKAYEIE